MLSHVFIGVNDFEHAYRFYDALMLALGHQPRFHDAARPWAGWMPADAPRPLLLIGAPQDGQPASVGNAR